MELLRWARVLLLDQSYFCGYLALYLVVADWIPQSAMTRLDATFLIEVSQSLADALNQSRPVGRSVLILSSPIVG